MHDGVNGGLRDDPADHGIADVSTHELSSANGVRWRDDVDADDPSDRLVTRQGLSHAATEIAGDTRDEHDLWH